MLHIILILGLSDFFNNRFIRLQTLLKYVSSAIFVIFDIFEDKFVLNQSFEQFRSLKGDPIGRT